MYQHVESDGDVFGQHPFVGMMAHASRTAQKEHRHRRHRGHHAGIVAGAADQAMRVVAGRRQVPRASQSAQNRIGRDGGVVLLLRDDELHASSPGEGSRSREYLAHGRHANVIVRVADVDAEPHRSGITLEAPGSTAQRTDRRPQAGNRSGEPLDLQHELGRGRERVEPAVPWAWSRRVPPGRAARPRFGSVPRSPRPPRPVLASVSSTGPCSMWTSR